MIEVIPAIMPKSFSDLSEKVSRVSSYASFIQIDLMDGKFVPEKTWPFFSYNDSDFNDLLNENKGLPEWEHVDYEVDLMTVMPDSDAFDWIQAGAKRIIIHVESTRELQKLIDEIRSEYGNPKESATAPEIGISAGNDTELSRFEEFIPSVDFVQCMGIARIGYQGEPFDNRVIERIKTLRQKFGELILSVDGGVTDMTAHALISAGANRLVSGSFIFGSGNIKEAMRTLAE